MAAPAPAAAPPKAAGRAKPTILVVEDLDFYTTLVSNALGAKYRTVAVDNVAAALNAMREEHVDLMVLDLTLKDGEDGRDVLRGLENKTCPILIFSAKDESEMYGATWQELRKLGADDMLIKGMNVQESLLQKIAGLLEKS
jgi:DNA-binding response OmpR family regulator